MKTFIFTILISAASAQAGGDQRILIQKCTEGSGTDQTTVTLETGGQTGAIIYGRVDRGSFHSGDIIVKPFEGPSIPENKTYVDVETEGKKFFFSYDFLNPNNFGALIYNDDLKSVPSTNKLICSENQ